MKKKLFKVRFTYTESGYRLIQAETSEKAEKKLNRMLSNDGFDALYKGTYNQLDRDFDAFGAEEVS